MQFREGANLGVAWGYQAGLSTIAHVLRHRRAESDDPRANLPSFPAEHILATSTSSATATPDASHGTPAQACRETLSSRPVPSPQDDPEGVPWTEAFEKLQERPNLAEILRGSILADLWQTPSTMGRDGVARESRGASFRATEEGSGEGGRESGEGGREREGRGCCGRCSEGGCGTPGGGAALVSEGVGGGTRGCFCGEQAHVARDETGSVAIGVLRRALESWLGITGVQAPVESS